MSIAGFCPLLLRVRLMVGHMPLEHGIGVRVPDPQPTRAPLETPTRLINKSLKHVHRSYKYK